MQMAMSVLEDPDVASRRARRVDAAAALGLAVFLVVGTYFASQDQPARRPFDAGTVVLLIAAAGAIAFRRRWPLGGLWFVFAVDLTYFALNYAPGPIWLTLVISSFTAVVEGHLRAAVTAAAAGFGIFPWLSYFLRDRPAPPIANLVGLAAWLLVILGAGLIFRTRRERVVEAARMGEGERPAGTRA